MLPYFLSVFFFSITLTSDCTDGRARRQKNIQTNFRACFDNHCNFWDVWFCKFDIALPLDISDSTGNNDADVHQLTLLLDYLNDDSLIGTHLDFPLPDYVLLYYGSSNTWIIPD